MFYAVTFRSLKPQTAFGFATLELAEVGGIRGQSVYSLRMK